MSKTIRPRLTPDEMKVVEEYRGIRKACIENEVDLRDVKHGWLKSKNASLFFKNNFATDEAKKEFEEKILQIVTDKAKKYKPTNVVSGGEHLLLIDPADIHIGSLSTEEETGQEYNTDIAINRVMNGVASVVNMAHTGFDICEVALVIGNDVLHVDNAFRTTTSGTHQDTDSMWYRNFAAGYKVYTGIVDFLLERFANVRVIYNPSNHDYTNGFFLAQVLQAHYRNCDSITFDVTVAHRKYFKFYNNLIGTTHGDGAKNDDLALLMAHEAVNNWSDCKHRYFYTHHVHHKQSKDIFSVCIESVRSPKTADSWHHRNGYQHAPSAIEAFLHHRENGQIARFSHIF